MLNGYVHPDFAPVAATLASFLRAREGGAAACVYHRGVKVVDLWGGTRDRDGQPWREDTLAPSFSTTKGVLSTLLHVLAEQGRVDYEDPVCRHWPEFATHGKERITVRHLMCHEAGLYRLGEMIGHPATMLDWNTMKLAMINARPVHEPGVEHGYHAVTYGWLLGGLIEAVTQQPLATVLNSELVVPLKLDGAYIGLPHEAMERRAVLTNGFMRPPRLPEAGWRADLLDVLRRSLKLAGVDTAEFRAALMPFDVPFDWNDPQTVQACIPAANGQFTARSLARLYAMIAEGGELDGVRLLSEERTRIMGIIRNRTRDNVLFIPMHFRLGYHRAFAFGVRAPHAFGHYGYGGSGAFCDPSRRLAVALTVNSGTGTPSGDSRTPRLAAAAMRAADRLA